MRGVCACNSNGFQALVVYWCGRLPVVSVARLFRLLGPCRNVYTSFVACRCPVRPKKEVQKWRGEGDTIFEEVGPRVRI